MLGLLGVVDLENSQRSDLANSLARQMASRLTGVQDLCEWRHTSRAVIARVGGEHHHNTAWSNDADAPAIAGIVHGQDGRLPPARDIEAKAVTGHFTALVPTRNDGLSIVADRRGSVPLFYARQDGLLLFAPEVKALLACSNLPLEIDEAALACFLASGHLVGDQTLLKSVRRLRGGHAITIDPDGKYRVDRYWSFRPGSRAATLSERKLGEALLDRVEAAMARNLAQPARTAIFLSGGADSRALLCAALSRVPASELTAVTWTNDEGGDRSDVDIAARVCRHAGVKHLVLKPPSSGFGDDFRRANALLDCGTDSAMLHPRLARMAEHLWDMGFTTALRGDEAFGWWYPAAALDDAMIAVGLRTMDEAAVAAAIRPELRDRVRAAQAETLATVVREVSGLRPDQMKDVLYFEHRLQAYLGIHNMLVQASLDHRNPLIDDEVLDVMECVPDKLRAHKLLFQRAMARRFPELWGIGLAGRVSSSSDWASLFTANRALLLEELTGSSSAIWNFIDLDLIRSLVDRPHTRARAESGWRSVVTSLARTVRPMLPEAVARALGQGHRKARPTTPARLIMRVLAVKNWQDGLLADRGRPYGGGPSALHAKRLVIAE
jgi:hypothetical protein